MLLAIDEMMIRFHGRSKHTTRVKNNPIKEGYKFFVMACSLTGFVLNFTPNGNVNDKKIGERNEFDQTNGGLIMNMFMFLIKPLLPCIQAKR